MSAREDAIGMLEIIQRRLKPVDAAAIGIVIEMLRPSKALLRQRKYLSKPSVKVDADIDAGVDAKSDALPVSPHTPLPSSSPSAQMQQQEIVSVSPAPMKLSDPEPSQKTRARGVKRVAPEIATEDSAGVWRAYYVAYQRRYGIAPVSNGKHRSQVRQFCARIPAEDWVVTIDHYLRSQNARYVASGHSVGCLLADAEKLRTEALTGRNGTVSAARKADHTAHRGQEYDEMFKRLAAKDAAEAETKRLNGK